MYDFTARGYNELHQEEQLKKLKTIKKHFQPQGLMLDLGAGTGISTFYSNSIALDKSFEMIKQFKGGKVVGDAINLPFKDNTFDSLICLTAFHNFSDFNKAIKEIKRVLKNHSSICITILKKSTNFTLIKKLLLSNLNLKEYDEEKDLILIGVTK